MTAGPLSLWERGHRTWPCLSAYGFGLPVYTRVDLAGIALGDLVAVFVAEPLDGLEDGYNFLEIPAGLWVNGIDGPKHLGGEQDVVHPDPFDQQLHSLFVVNGHIPVHSTRSEEHT